MYWWKKIGHKHRFDLCEKQRYGDSMIFKFSCVDCGQLKTKIVGTDQQFEMEI